jgi:putative transposase
MEVSGARRLKALEDENGRLKRLLAEWMLDASTLKEMLGKKLSARRPRSSKHGGSTTSEPQRVPYV